jgi:predicted DNA-binding protein (UPF0251 family)
MSIDVKKLLYKYPKLIVALGNIQRSLGNLTKQYPNCTARYSDEICGRGGLPFSQTERYAFHNVVEIEEKREQLMWDMEDYLEAINLVETALATLNERQQELIRLRYFEDREPVQVANMMNISVDHFWKLHKIAFEGIEDCLNGGNIVLNNSRLIPMKTTKNTTKNTTVTRIKTAV